MTRPIYIRHLPLGAGIPKICVPLTGKTREEILSQAEDAVKAGADLLEWRVDLWQEANKKETLEEMLFAISGIRGDVPLIFTIRTTHEGGAAEISLEEYENLNLLAAESGKADLIDVEYLWESERKNTLIESLHGLSALVIASSHDFAKTDDEETLRARFGTLDHSGADILKMAVMPRDFEDVSTLMKVVHNVTTTMTDKPVIAMAMGSEGTISRFAGENYGSCLTFGTVGEASAPGQVPIAELRSLMEALHRENMVEKARDYSNDSF